MNTLIKSISLLSLGLLCSAGVEAGNPDRAGTAGATELLINPWARSSGWGYANGAGVNGVESFFLNVAGLAATTGTEVNFSHTRYLASTSINNFGFAQTLGKDKDKGTIGLSVFSMNFGNIMRTTEAQPDGGLGTFSPQYLNIGLGYSKKFNDQIYGGMLFRIISEGTADVKAQGFCLDAGVQYRTSLASDPKLRALKGKDLRFGISIRNIGPDMSFSGDGLSGRYINPNTGISSTLSQRSAAFNLPSLVNISLGHDFRLDKQEGVYNNRLTLAANFTSNTFSNNQTTLGLEYGYKNFFMLRGGFVYEKDIFSQENRTNVFTGYCGGFTLEFPFGKTNSTFALDYSYRSTMLFNGVHTFGVRVNLGTKTN